MASVQRIIEMCETLKVEDLEYLLQELEEMVEEKKEEEFVDNF